MTFGDNPIIKGKKLDPKFEIQDLKYRLLGCRLRPLDRPFDKHFDKLRVLSYIERLKVPSMVEGLRATACKGGLKAARQYTKRFRSSLLIYMDLY